MTAPTRRPARRPHPQPSPRRGLAAVGAALLLLVTACGGSSEGTTATTTPEPSAPTAGGTLRVAVVGGAGDSLDVRTSGGMADYTVLYNVWEPLALIRDGEVALGLATSVTPNGDATTWTVELQPEATFHDGSPLTAADAAWSLRHLAGETSAYALAYGDVDLDGLREVDEHTLEIPLRRPRGDFLEAVLAVQSLVIRDGATDLTTGNGTGPFTLDSYRADEGAELVANPDYWGPAPLLDGVEVRVINSATARLDAVRGGEIDYAVAITPTGALTLEGDPEVEVRRGGVATSNAYLFPANASLAPFDDPQVRKALRLAIDREALVETILLGQGTVGNDLVGQGQPGYADQIPQRTRDVDEARRLFAEAGVTELTIRASDIAPGLVDSARLLQEQLAEVGVTLTVDEVPADAFFGDYTEVLATPLQTYYATNWLPASYVPSYLGSAATFNITGFREPEFDELLAAMQTEVDDEARAAKLVALQEYLHENGGEVVWGYAEQLDAVRPGVQGVSLSVSFPLFGAASLV